MGGEAVSAILRSFDTRPAVAAQDEETFNILMVSRKREALPCRTTVPDKMFFPSPVKEGVRREAHDGWGPVAADLSARPLRLLRNPFGRRDCEATGGGVPKDQQQQVPTRHALRA